jgi:hypothetical protein
MKYIKQFENINLFQNWKDSEEYVIPNVTYITENGGSIIYDPKNYNLICTYNITTPGSTYICWNSSNVK